MPQPRLRVFEADSTSRSRRGQLPTEYYNELRNGPQVEGPFRQEYAFLTRKSLDLIWRRWSLFCKEVKEDPHKLMRTDHGKNFTVFFRWMLDRFCGVRAKSTLHNYWRRFRLLYAQINHQVMDETKKKTINSYIWKLYKEYKLNILPRDKPVMSVDDLSQVMIHHWFYDSFIYPDERQRVQLAFLLLIGAYTGQRPCSILETRTQKDRDQIEAAAEQNRKRLKDPIAEKYFKNCDSDNADATALPVLLQRGIAYKHIRLFVLRNENRNQLAMMITFVHTKNEDRRPQRKRFLFHENERLLLCPIAHFLALAFADHAFEASSLKEPNDLFRVQVPSHKKSLLIAWKKSIRDLPVMRQARRPKGSAVTSSSEPLQSATSARYLRRLGQNVGFQYPLTHYAMRRGTGNAVDDTGTAAERNQVMGHLDSRTFEYYLNEQVKLDVQSAFLGKPSKDTLLKAVGHMGLTVDCTAPTSLTSIQKQEMRNNQTIAQLSRKCNELSQEIIKVFGSRRCPKSSELFREKQQIKVELKRREAKWRHSALKEARRKHFESADTMTLEAQLQNAHSDAPNSNVAILLRERRQIIELLRDVTDTLCKKRDEAETEIHTVAA